MDTTNFNDCYASETTSKCSILSGAKLCSTKGKCNFYETEQQMYERTAPYKGSMIVSKQKTVSVSKVGKNIRSIRLSKRLKQSDIAERMGVSKCQVSNYEISGRNLRRDTLNRIAVALDVDVSEILEGA